MLSTTNGTNRVRFVCTALLLCQSRLSAGRTRDLQQWQLACKNVIAISSVKPALLGIWNLSVSCLDSDSNDRCVAYSDSSNLYSERGAMIVKETIK